MTLGKQMADELYDAVRSKLTPNKGRGGWSNALNGFLRSRLGGCGCGEDSGSGEEMN